MVSEGVWGGFNAKSVHDTQILPFFQCRYCIKMPCLGVSELCLRVSGWDLRVSGDVLI